ncbi:alpha/beta hydrolase [Corynebacterium crudilactis]|uniref:AB hydrolase-1 domain-containing protein n=1 Tax=Corynebacterium crudilactis TaxID=1652495 RepID=A0A172QVU0_9CORY|nr:alpha/beta hydrolase [Corynebacterium crudilactis]ANE04766.1 hypothetical protein ccrud_11565 [Corynebacterium crudilactis]
MTNPYEAFVPLKHRTGIQPENTWWEWESKRIHIARRRREAPVRVIVVHGLGTHSGALWPLVAAIEGADLAAIDLPKTPLYDDWLRLLEAFITSENDGRPLILIGAGTGGLLSAEAASRTGLVSHVIVTCLLNPADQKTRRALFRFSPLTRLIQGSLRNREVSTSRVVNFNKISRSPGLSKLCAADEHSGASKITWGFLASYLQHKPKLGGAPALTLMHPDHDKLTPAELSLRTFKRIPATSEVVMLKDCGHFPIEEPGFSTMIDTVRSIVARNS